MSTGDPKIWDNAHDIMYKSSGGGGYAVCIGSGISVGGISANGSSGAGCSGATHSYVNSQVNPGVSLDNATINGTPIDVQGMTVWNLVTNLDESDICDKLERMSDNGIKTIREQLDTVKTLIERELFRRT